jgi:hypothetical protein
MHPHSYSRPALKNKLPRWVQQFLLPEHTSLSYESAVYAAKRFFRSTCDRGDALAEPGARGKVLLDEEQARALLVKLTEEQGAPMEDNQ